MLYHNVHFYLKEGSTQQQKDLFFEGLKTLAKIESLSGFEIGVPAKTAERPVVDNKYDFVIITKFESIADHDAYIAHDIHQEFLKNFKSYCYKT